MAAEERTAARLAAVQALYQMEVTGKGLREICAEFETFWIGHEIEGVHYRPAEIAFFRAVLGGVVEEQESIDRLIDTTLQEGWKLPRIDTVMRAILRAGTYELKRRKDVPARVVIAEYADVAAAFLAREEVGMINAVLDTLARRLRPDDFEGR